MQQWWAGILLLFDVTLGAVAWHHVRPAFMTHWKALRTVPRQSSGEDDLLFGKEMTLEHRNDAGFSKAIVLDCGLRRPAV